MFAEFETIGTESIGQQDLRPGFQVLVVDAGYRSRGGQVQFIEALVKGGATRVQECTHGTIGQERRGGGLEQGQKFASHFIS